MFLFRKKQSDRPLLVDDSNLPVEAPTPVVGGGPALIAVMGAAKSGKTQFVNKVSKSYLKDGHSLEPRTTNIQFSEEFELDGRQVVLIDTPGFDDTDKSNTEVLESIAAFLENLYSTGTRLTGIVYIHRISDVNFEGSVAKNFQMFGELCGEAILKNVVLVTNMWGQVTMPEGTAREKELQNNHFKFAITKGATLLRYEDTPESAREILRTIVDMEPVVLKIQQELVDEGKELGQTGAWEALSKEVYEMMIRHKEEIMQLEKSVREATEKKYQDLCQELDEKRKMLQEETERFKGLVTGMEAEFVEQKISYFKSWFGGASAHSVIRQTFERLDRSSTDFGDKLYKILQGPEYAEWALTLEKNDLTWFIEYLDQVLESLDPSDPASRKCVRELKTICRTHAILPTSYAISSSLVIDDYPFTSGGFADVYKGTAQGSTICVKRPRAAGQNALLEAKKMLCEEAVMWKYLKHQNILPLLGTSISPPQFVSPFMSAGDLSEYVRKDPDANRLRLLSQIAEGLCYLHSRNIIHGDLKGMNVLVEIVDNTPHARIADFGIAIVTRRLDSVRPATRQGNHTPRWSAPEVLLGENPTKKSDVYSFSMVVAEILSNQDPFHGTPHYLIVSSILTGERPPRPTHPSCTDDLWTMIQRCWVPDPDLRPEMLEVRKHFL